jgi:putative SOS response-associated peptidase YedK
MCNHALRERHVLKYAADLLTGLEIPDPVPEFTPHAYPKSPSPIVVEQDGRRRLQMLRWGVGYAVKGKPTFVTNARDDQLLRAALWKTSVAKRRCLIPVTGYFEPGPGPVGARGEVFFTLRDRPAFFIAGLWEDEPDGARAYSMVTTSPNALAAPFNDRQPVVLTDADAPAWLGSQPLPPERVVALTRPPPSEIMQYEIIPAVPRAKKPVLEDATGELDLGL